MNPTSISSKQTSFPSAQQPHIRIHCRHPTSSSVKSTPNPKIWNGGSWPLHPQGFTVVVHHAHEPLQRRI